MSAPEHRYLVALGSNRRHPRHGAPRRILEAAIAAMAAKGLAVQAVSPMRETVPVGPSHRRYTNAAAVVATAHEPETVMAHLSAIEDDFGRRRSGSPWRARVLDLDIILWSGGAWTGDALVIPHPLFRQREFVLGPARTITPAWRDPLTGLRISHLYARLTKRLNIPR